MTTRRVTRGPIGRSAAVPAAALVLSFCAGLPALAGPYVTETSGIRWNDVGGIRWNDVGGVRWNDLGGIRWNDVGGVRWNDLGGLLWSDATGLRWSDPGGIRWNDVGALLFEGAPGTGAAGVDLELLSRLSFLPDTSWINVVVTYRAMPTAADLVDLQAMGIPGGTRFRRLPMVVVNATRDQIARIAALPAVRSVFANRSLSFLDAESRALIGLDELAADLELPRPGGAALSGAGVTIAVLDTGVDATHPDLPFGSKVVGNVRLSGAVGVLGFSHPAVVEGLPNTDWVLGHGTSVASVAAGSGAASAGANRGVAPGASILGLSAGDLFIIHVLEGFDYVLEHAARYGVRVVNCSWGTEGWFDPDDPVNIATRLLHDQGITVVFAAGNQGPAPDSLNPYSVAPWVIGVGSSRKDGRLSRFSSRGVFEEVLYHPALIAPGESIVAAAPLLLDPAGGFYATRSGTSFAAPHVAGVAALVLQARPDLAPAEIKRLLMATGTPVLERDRSEVGAGRLDAWAAVTGAVDPARPFGTHVPGWLDQRPYRIEHRPAVEAEAVLPAGGRLTIPATLEPGALSWQATLAWGTLPGANDLDVVVRDAGGAAIERGDAFNGASLFGRTEGVHLLGALPGALDVEVLFKAGSGLFDQKFRIRQETAVAVVTAYADVAALAPADRDAVTRVVGRNVLIGRGDRFEAAATLSRGELARALALAAGRPQRIPSSPSFFDVPAAHPLYPYVESVAGRRARQVLVEPQNMVIFGEKADVTRIEFTVSVVRAAGLEAEAAARAGESLGLLDDGTIPLSLRGYVAVALERGLIDVIPVAGGWQFDHRGKLPRITAARFLPRLLDLR